MSDEVKQQVSEEPKDNGVPTPKFSEAPASPTSSLTPDAVASLSAALKPVIEEAIDRKFKSTTDKRFSKLEKGEGVLREVLATLKEQGVNIPDSVARDYEIRDYIDQRLKEVVPQAKDSGVSALAASGVGQFDVISELKQRGLESTDPEVVTLLGGQYRNPDHFRAAAADLALRKAAKPTPSQSAAPVMQGSAGRPLSEVEKEMQYAKLKELYKTPTKSATEIARLEKELGM
jgi:hypothetical protein